MTPEDRGNQPATPQSQPGQDPASQPAQGPTKTPRPGSRETPTPYDYNTRSPNQYHYDRPQPAARPGPDSQPDPAVKKPLKPALRWGGLALGLLVMTAVVVLVVIPLFNGGTRAHPDPFGVSKDVPAVANAQVSGTVVVTNTTEAVSGPEGTTAPAKGALAQVVAKGEFTKIDANHYARGTATVGIGENGQKILRFENFTSAQGPDLKVYLGTRSDGSRVKDGGLNLGALPATEGSYNIVLADDLDLSKYKSVVIWSEPFSATFSVASLS